MFNGLTVTHVINNVMSNTLGVGLSGYELSGSAYFIVDTRKKNAHILEVGYSAIIPNVTASSLSAKVGVSNFSCYFSAYSAISASEDISNWGLSGRYVKFVFDMERDSEYIKTPRVVNVSVDFKYNHLDYSYRVPYKTKSDIFGIQYSLLKDDLDLDQYYYKFEEGEVIARTLDNRVVPIRKLLPSQFAKYAKYESIYPLLSSQMSTGVRDMEILYDIMMLVTEDYIVIEKFLFDYSTGMLTTKGDNFFVIPMSEESRKYSDIWFFESDKRAVICTYATTQLISGVAATPHFYKLDIANGRLKEFDLIDEDSQISQLSSLRLSSIETPVFTYNSVTNTFDFAYLGYTASSAVHIAQYTISYDTEEFILDSVNVVAPVDYT